MAFGVYSYSAAPPRVYASSSSSRRGGGAHSRRSVGLPYHAWHRTHQDRSPPPKKETDSIELNRLTTQQNLNHRQSVWAAFIVLMVCFYAGVLYLSHLAPHPHPALRQQLSEAATPAVDAAAALVHNPPGSVDGVVVLGMHRSGTSMITGLLQRLGLHLGPAPTLLGAVAGENDKGFFERIQVINQNDQLMRAQDVNWALNVFNFDHLEAIRAALSDKRGLFAEGMAALAFYNNPSHAPWAVKDPRLCITLKFWMAFWKTPPAVLIVYRHPIEVAKSLVRRKEFGLTRGLHLWMAYNRCVSL